MLGALRELYARRDLLYILTWREIKVRYKQSVMGLLWAVLMPLVIVCAGVVVRFAFSRVSGTPLALSDLTAVTVKAAPWAFFVAALRFGTNSLVTNSNLVTKVYFPRVLLPLAGVVVPIVDFVLGSVVLLVLMWRYQAWPAGATLALAPLFILLACVTALGIGFGLSALNVRYRDVPYAIPVFLQVLPFVSGVPYALTEIPTKWQWILSVNPMTAVIGGWRWAVLGAEAPDAGQVGVSVAVAILLLLGGLAFFRSSEPRFADTI